MPQGTPAVTSPAPLRARCTCATLTRAGFAHGSCPRQWRLSTPSKRPAEPCVSFRRAVHRHPPSLSSTPDGPRITEAVCARLCDIFDSGCAAWHHGAADAFGDVASCVLSGAGVKAAGMALDDSGAEAWRYAAGDGGGDAITRSYPHLLHPSPPHSAPSAWPTSAAMAVCVLGGSVGPRRTPLTQ